MNIQALMKQAQNMQKEIQKAQEEVGKMEFTSKKELVEVTVNGNKEIISVKIDENVEKDDIEVLQDMILLATNDAINQANAEMEKRLGKYSSAMPGLF